MFGIARGALPGFEDVVAGGSAGVGEFSFGVDGGVERRGADVNHAVHVAVNRAKEADEAGFFESDALAGRGTPEAEVELLGRGLREDVVLDGAIFIVEKINLLPGGDDQE